MKEDHEDFTLKYDDSPKAKERVYAIALKWFKKMDHFSGESLGQSDVVYELAPEIMGELADKGFKFKQDWKD